LEANLTERETALPKRGAVVVGDVFVDCVGHLSTPQVTGLLRDPDADLHAFAPVAMEIGGAGVQFAVAARAAGFEPVTLIGKVGGAGDGRPDEPGERARRFLMAHGVVPMLAVEAGGASGRALILYTPPDRRIMISDPLANTTLQASDIGPEMETAAREAAFVYVSGFVLLQPGRHAAAMCILAAGRAGGATTALDLVPHDIYRYLTYERLRDRLGGIIDWLVVELPAACRLLGHARGDAGTPPAGEVLGALACDFPSVALYVEPGRALVAHRGERSEQRFEYLPGVHSRGQSARAQAELFAKYR